MKTLILVPTMFEAKILDKDIEKNKIKNINKNYDLIVCGIGKKSLKTIKENLNYKNFILLGFAGNLKEKNLVGKTFNISMVSNKYETLELKTFKNLKLKSANILTSKTPINSKEKKEKLKNFDLVDMETFYLAKFLKSIKKDFYCIRVVSDNADTKEIKNYFLEIKKPNQKINPFILSLKETFNTILNSKAL
jgi:hypothetical protein